MKVFVFHKSEYVVFVSMLMMCISIVGCSDENFPKFKYTSAISILQNKPDLEMIVMECDKTWEKGLSFPCICKNTDTGIYYMYYSAWTDNKAMPFVNCVATSEDGLIWDKPNLDLCSYVGGGANIFSTEYENVTVSYYDGLFYLIGYKLTGTKETVIKISRDGIHFDKTVNSIFYLCDSSNQLLKVDNKFFIYLRSWYYPNNEKIDYHHVYNGFKVYRGVSLVKLNTINQALYNQTENLFIWGNDSLSALTDEYYPVVMKNISNEDYDIYNPCIHIYDDGSIIAYPILFYHISSNYGNDGYSKIGFWTTEDFENFKQISTKYIESDYWLEFATDHYEDEKKYIHYLVDNDKTHGSPEIGNTSIRARIHYK